MKIVADNSLKLILLFGENKTWHLMWIVSYADNSHEMSNLIFSEKKYFKVLSAAVAISA